ncbi:unnamed protein product [Rhodiola kirilowii]
MLAKLLANQEEMRQELKEVKKSNQRLETHNKMLENQIAQQAESSTRAQGKLAAQPEQGQREHCNAVTLRSGKELEDEQPKKKKVSFDLGGQASAEIEEFDEEVPNPQNQKKKEVEKEKDELKAYTPPIPFPQRLKKKSNDKQFLKFSEMMRKLYVTMSFTEVITQAPSYARFLKDVITCRRTIEDVDTKLNMGESKPTQMILSLADRSSRFPKGVLKDVPVKVGNFYNPGDFIVLEMEEDNEIPIVLGRPFLYTEGAIF